jgi:hypothetical protein
LPNPIVGEARSAPAGKVLAPIGGHFGAYGPWEDVELVARAPSHVDDVAITTSFRKHEIKIDGTVVGEAKNLRVEALVLDGDKIALHVPANTAEGGKRWTISAPFKNALPWSPESPHLYKLRVLLFSGNAPKPIDVHEEIFGFRELWAQGSEFYLNGVKRHLLATSTWPTASPQPREEIARALAKMKEGNNVAFRLHTQPWPRAWLEEADRIGILIVEEGAMWCDSGGAYAYKDDRFWKNAQDMLLGMVRRDRNHASLGMWSLENELMHCGAAKFDSGVEKKLGNLARSVKELDPTHLVTFEADRDPDGAADVIGLHYPHEAPDFSDYPNTADWVDSAVTTGTAGGLMGSSGSTFLWDHKKPLYIGEYLWCPTEDYALGSVFFGPAVYRDHDRYSDLAKARAWFDQTIAYRRAGVSAFCPWTAFEHGGKPNQLFDVVKELFTPIAGFVRERDRRFFSRKTIERTVDVFNDSGAATEVELSFEIAQTSIKGKRTIALGSAEYQATKIVLPLPRVTDATRLELVTHVRRGGKELHSTRTELWVEPKKALAVPAGVKLWVFDPKSKWLQRAQSEGLVASPLDGFADLAKLDPNQDLLLIAPGALTSSFRAASALPTVGTATPGSAEFGKFVADGGRVLILEQQSYAGLPIGAVLVDHPSTLTFPVDPRHPLLAGVTTDDLRHWRGDHYVSRREIQRPQSGGGRALVVSGGARELDQAPIVEKTAGAGKLLLVQALVGEKYLEDPTARRLLQNALGALAAQSGAAGDRTGVGSARPRRTVVVSDEASLGPALIDLGVDFQSAPRVPFDLRAGDVLVLGGGGARVKSAAGAVTAFLKAAGPKATIYWHAPTPEAFDGLGRVLGAQGIRVANGSGPLAPVADVTGPFAAVCVEDFLFKGPRRGASWMKGFEPDPSVARQIFAPQAGAAMSVLPLGGLEGQYVSKTSDGGVLFATNGSATAEVDIAEAGLYPVRITAEGTPLKGVLPTFRVGLRGSSASEIPLTEKGRHGYDALLALPKGHAILEVRFVNDGAEGGEDRNLTVKKLELSSKPWSGGTTRLLTLPAAVVQLSPPSAPATVPATVIVDNVAWTDAKSNAQRAGRYATSLLGALGVRFRSPGPEPVWLGPRAFKLVTESPHSGVTDGEIEFRTAGKVTGAFEAARAGRYAVLLRGRSDPAANVWASAEISLDGKRVTVLDVNSRDVRTFEGPTVDLVAGRHELSIAFTNDVYTNGQDRNLYVNDVGLREERAK